MQQIRLIYVYYEKRREDTNFSIKITEKYANGLVKRSTVYTSKFLEYFGFYYQK